MVSAAAEPLDAPAAPPRFDYLTADAPLCDIVMKGGVTSGVVYPLAICELATAYRFRSIGGTSAGAIAAVATAAAEYRRRRHGSAAGFEQLEQLPQWLGAETLDRTNLVALFRPHAETAPLFAMLVAALKRPSRRVLALVLAAIRRFPAGAFAGASPGVLLVIALAVAASGGTPARVLAAVGLVSALVVLVAGAVVGALAGAARRAMTALRPETGFGLCPGGGAEAGRDPLARDAPPAPLAVWLADLIDELAGVRETGRPLTFADLWCADETENEPVETLRRRLERDRAINLATITTALSLGRPYRLPFEGAAFPGGDVPFLLREGELEAYFPHRVAAFLEEKAREKAVRDGLVPPVGYLPFPDAPDVPVVFAARLSLSFPILLSAVPLYVLDEAGRPRRCWFSDGGIASNFPIHFFDAPLPRWPTFGINLRGPRAEHPSLDAWLDDYSDSTVESWEEIQNVREFLDSLKDTAQNWLDNAQRRLPAGRDRVAQIPFDHAEGGLNLFMPGPTIATLSERGRRAGQLLRDRFTEPQPPDRPSWPAHRWVRYRTSMRVLAGDLRALSRGWGEEPPEWGPSPPPGPRVVGPGYHELLQRGLQDPPTVLPWASEERRAQAQDDTERLVRLARAWNEAFENAPILPEPDLRAAPRV